MNDNDGTLKIDLFWPGVWGPNSVFPLHLSEQAYFCTTRQDYGLSDFADIFHTGPCHCFTVHGFCVRTRPPWTTRKMNGSLFTSVV